MTNSMTKKTRFSIFAASFALVFTTAFSLSSLAQPNPYEPHLYNDQSILKFTLVAPFQKISGLTSHFGQEYPGSKIILPDGTELGVTVKPRGKSSFAICRFKKLDIELTPEASAKNSPFKGVKEFKVGTHCDINPNALNKGMLGTEEAVYREYAAYSIHSVLTESAHRARRGLITYRDSDNQSSITKQALLFEDFGAVRKRVGGTKIEESQIQSITLDQDALALMYLFEILIDNADWQVGSHNILQATLSPKALWNSHVYTAPNGSTIPVPMDFDISGFVTGKNLDLDSLHPDFLKNAPSLTKGFVYRLSFFSQFFSDAVIQKAIAHVNGQRDEIQALIKNAAIDPKGYSRIIKQVDLFFAALNLPKTQAPRLKKGLIEIYADKSKKKKLCSKFEGGTLVIPFEKVGVLTRIELVSSFSNDQGHCEGLAIYDTLEIDQSLWVLTDSLDN